MARSDHHNIVTMVTCLPTLKSNKTLNKLKHLFWTSTWQFVPGIHWLSLELWSMVHCTKLELPTLRPHDEDKLQVVSLVMVGSGDKLDLWELNWYWSMWISLCRNCFNFDGNSNSMSSRISNNFITDLDLFLHCILSAGVKISYFWAGNPVGRLDNFQKYAVWAGRIMAVLNEKWGR